MAHTEHTKLTPEEFLRTRIRNYPVSRQRLADLYETSYSTAKRRIARDFPEYTGRGRMFDKTELLRIVAKWGVPV